MLHAFADRIDAAVIGLHGVGDDDAALAMQSRLFGEFEIGPDTDGHHHEIGRQLRTIAKAHAGNAIFAGYLGIPHVPGAGNLTIICAAIIGAGLAFLWFNAPPAAVFMGDTGSLALGGALGAIAVSTHHEIVLGIVGGLFVVEAVSVILQVFFYKRTGKRIFKMAPIHHHFEQIGWSEPTVVIRFWIVSFVLALAGLATLKLR